MKLLHVVDTLNPKMGGVSHAVQTMSEEVFKVGLFNAVVTSDGWEDITYEGPVEITCLGPAKRPWSYNRNLVPWLLNNFDRFDTIIVHGLWLYQTYAVAKALSIYKKQFKQAGKVAYAPGLYIMPHGMLDPYFQRTPGRKVKAIRNWLYWKLIEGSVLNGADGLLFTCKEECLLAKIPFSPYRPKRELVIGLGVPEPPPFCKMMEEAFLDSCPDLRDQKYLLFLSRIDKKKGIDHLIQAYRRIVYEFGHRKLSPHESTSLEDNALEDYDFVPDLPKLVIAGPGLDSEYGKMITALVDDSPRLRSLVFFTGMLEGPQKWGAFYGSQAFILPSHQENFGIAVVEALACGKPVLISNQINIWSEIKEAEAGIVTDDTEAGAYKAIKTWLKLSEIERLRMENQAKKCYEKHFALDAATSRLINALSYKQ